MQIKIILVISLNGIIIKIINTTKNIHNMQINLMIKLIHIILRFKKFNHVMLKMQVHLERNDHFA